MTKKKALTQQTSKEEWWVVETGNKQFTLTEEQVDLLKKASIKGYRGIVWFDEFAISIPHIQYIKKEKQWARIL